jgi:hypothetical protein
MAGKKRRIRSPHPGVVLKQRTLPSGASAWRARFDDPDSGREVYITLHPTELSTAEARRLWAIRKSKTLAKRRMELEAGAAIKSETPIAGAVDVYLVDAKHRLRASTLRTYRHQGLDQFRRWVASRNLAHIEELTQPLDQRRSISTLVLKQANGRDSGLAF